MKVFTVSNGTVELGARVQEVKIESAGFSFKAISVGERGRGRTLATLPVDEKAVNLSKEVAKVFNADLGKTKSGKTKLFKENNVNNESCVVVFRTDIGFRGGNNHTGDRTPETMESDNPKFLDFPGDVLSRGVIAQGDAGRMGSGERGRGRILATLPVDEKALNSSKEVAKVFNADLGKTKSGKTKLFKESNSNNESCVVVFRTDIGFRGGNNHTGDRTPETMGSEDPKFLDFPGDVLSRGVIAQGDAGRMGSGEQIIAIMPKGVVFRTAYYGRLYGAPSAHYYIFDGEKIIAVTWEERCSSDIF